MKLKAIITLECEYDAKMIKFGTVGSGLVR